MTRDQNKIVKKEQNKASKKRDEAIRRRKNNEESSDDDGPYSSESESDEMDQHEYRKFLAKMFPSKHAKDKVKAGDKLKKVLKNDIRKKNKKEEISDEEDIDNSESEDDSDYVPKKSKSKSKGKKCKSSRLRRKVYESESEEEELEEDDETLESEDDTLETEETEDEDEELDDEEEDEEEERPRKKSKKSDNFNIVLTIGNGVNREEELEDEYAEFFNDEDWETCSDDDAETENEDDPISSDSESEEDTVSSLEEEILPKKKKGSTRKTEKKDNKKTADKKVSKKKGSDDKESEKEIENIKLITTEKTSDVETQIKLLAVLNGLKDRGENTDLVNECIKVCNQKMEVEKKKSEKKLQKEKDRNDRIFKRILKDKNTMNDFEFFEKMEVSSQKKIIKELREINKLTRIEKPYRLTLLEADIPVVFKGAAMKRVASLRYMEPGSGEYYKIKTWVDTFMRIPFSKYQNLPITIEDGI